MYQAKSDVKNFSLTGGGGVPRQKFFSPFWTCIKPNLVSKIFPFTGGGGGPLTKFFPPVWTCIKPNLVSKNFPFTGGGRGVPWQNFFFSSEHVSSQIWCQKFFPLLRQGTPPAKNLRLGTPPKIWDLGPPSPQKSETWAPLKIWDLGPLPPENLRPGTPPTWTWDTPPPPKVWTDTQTGVKTLPSLVLRTRAVKISNILISILERISCGLFGLECVTIYISLHGYVDVCYAQEKP